MSKLRWMLHLWMHGLYAWSSKTLWKMHNMKKYAQVNSSLNSICMSCFELTTIRMSKFFKLCTSGTWWWQPKQTEGPLSTPVLPCLPVCLLVFLPLYQHNTPVFAKLCWLFFISKEYCNDRFLASKPNQLQALNTPLVFALVGIS